MSTEFWEVQRVLFYLRRRWLLAPQELLLAPENTPAGYAWNSCDMHGIPMDFQWNAWNSYGIHGIPTTCMELMRNA